MKPTPGEWRVSPHVAQQVRDAKGVPLFGVCGLEEPTSRDEANAALIVAAVNALFKVKTDATVKEYEDLASAIPAMVELYKKMMSTPINSWDERVVELFQDSIRTLLASAGIEWRET